MRVKISVNKFAYSGYYNIDPDPVIIDGVNTTPSSIRDLDQLDDRECDEIILDECLCYIPHAELGNYLDKVLKKLRKGGKLVIIDKDVRSLSYDYYSGIVNEDYYNNALFGNQNRPSTFKTSCLSLKMIKEHLSEICKISKIINTGDYNFLLEVVNE